MSWYTPLVVNRSHNLLRYIVQGKLFLSYLAIYRGMNGDLLRICAHTGLSEPEESTEDGEMNQIELPPVRYGVFVFSIHIYFIRLHLF